MNGLAKLFGRQVRVTRRARGLTQEQLGRAAKLDYKHIGSIERGEKTPSFDAIERIAKALGVEYYQLFLPDRLSVQLLEQQLDDLSRNLGQLERSHLDRFCRDVITAIERVNKQSVR